MAYFDNAATTFPKPETVYAQMDEFYRNCGGSAGRGSHNGARTAGALIADTRNGIQDLLHCPAKQVVFTPTATIALNMIIQGVVDNKIRNVYISPFEHNAVTRVLHHLEQIGNLQVRQLYVSEQLTYDMVRIRYQFDKEKPDVVIVSHASNVIGLVAPVEDIFSLAKRYGAITIVDMAQTAGLVDLNVGLSTIDFAVFAGHKTLYGPTGISGFVMNPGFDLKPVLFGGTGYDSTNQDMPESVPERYEMGTINISGMAGLNASLKWIKEQGMDWLYEIEQNHRTKLIELLLKYDFIKIIGNNHALRYVGIVSVLIDGISSDSAGELFSRLDISVRTGLHCAPLAHKFMHTFPAGTVRFSVNSFTTDEDFKVLQKALDYIGENL